MGAKYCSVCNSPLSQCGHPNGDGEPTMDCEPCQLRAEIERWKDGVQHWRDKFRVLNREVRKQDNDIKRLKEIISRLLEHAGEKVVNGIGMELDSEELQKAKEDAYKLLK